MATVEVELPLISAFPPAPNSPTSFSCFFGRIRDNKKSAWTARGRSSAPCAGIPSAPPQETPRLARGIGPPLGVLLQSPFVAAIASTLMASSRHRCHPSLGGHLRQQLDRHPATTGRPPRPAAATAPPVGGPSPQSLPVRMATRQPPARPPGPPIVKLSPTTRPACGPACAPTPRQRPSSIS